MKLQNKNIFDETFDIDRCESYTLSIQISPKGYSFTVKDTVKNSFIVLNASPFSNEVKPDDDWTEPVKNMFTKHELLSKRFKKVFLSFESQLFTLVPAELFTPEKAKQLFSIVWDLPEQFELHYKEINKMVLLFAIPTTLIAQIKLKQPGLILVGHPTPLVNFAVMSMATSAETVIAANISENFVVNLTAQGKVLKNLTPYPYHTIDDIIYHLVNCCKQQDLTAGDMNLVLTGVGNDQQDFILLLSKFFKKVTLDKGLMGDHYSYSIDRYKTEYWNLFNISQCE